jgi:ATP-dependent exoDNAse (exonuclease V) beta subunit
MQEVLRQHNPLHLPAAFYLDEWEDVAQEREALTEEAYLQVDRAGRGRALNRRQRADHEERERRLLYVAMTRARELLWISGSDAITPFLA